MIKAKRIYDEKSPDDGFRILVDRLWPRGISKEKADIGLWLKEIAPSDELRRWFSHDPSKWKGFCDRYHGELSSKSELVDRIRQIEKKEKKVTLLYAAKDTEHNNAVALIHLLQQ